MKFATSALILATIAKAQNDTISARKFSAIMDMIFAFDIDTVHEPQVFWKMITNYGCHCFPDYTRKTTGVGSPKNDVDTACRELERCKKCIDIEGMTENCENEDVDQGKYDYESLPNSGTVTCNPRGRNTDCKNAQCECDKQFAMNLANVWKDEEFNKNLWLNNKNVAAMEKAGIPVFTYNDECVKVVGDPSNACCGNSYPNKHPFNSDKRECCADGSLKLIGGC